MRTSAPLLMPLIALGFNLALIPLLNFESPFLAFTGAVLISAWLGGTKSGMLATAVSLVAITLFFQIGGDLQVGPAGHILRLSMFFTEGVLISLLIGTLQSTARRAQQQEAELHTIINGVPDYAIVLLDAAGCVASWSTGATQITGYSAAEIIGQKLARFYTPGAVEEGVPALTLQQSMTAGRYADDGWRVRKDGTHFWATSVIARLIDPVGRLRGYTMVMRDVTEQRLAAQTLRAAHDELEHRVDVRTAELRLLNTQLVEQAESLAIRKARYRTLVQHLPNITVLMFDQELRYLVAEGRALGRNDFDAAAMVGRTLWEVMPAERAEVLAVAYRAALAGEQRTMEHVRGDQTYRTRFVPIAIDNGPIVTAMAVTEDTTEQTRAERQIRQSEAQLRHMGQMAKIGGWSLDLATMTPAWSDEIYRIHELNPGEQPSMEQMLTFFPPSAHVVAENMITWTSHADTHWDVELPSMTAKGRAIWVRAQGEIEERQGVVVGLRGTLQDITERRELEETLHERNLIHTTLFQVLPIGVTITDADGQIKDANPTSERLLGLSRAEHQRIDSAAWQVIRPDGSPMPNDEYAGVRAIREQRLISDIEIGVVQPAGETAWLSVTATPMPLAGYGAVIVYSDITQRTEMDQMLRRTLAERETLLKEIHHRVKNNLQVVISLLRLQGRQVHDSTATAVLLESRQRVEVIAFVHELLYQSDDLASISASAYIQQLSQHVARIYTTQSQHIELQVTAADIWLSLDQAVPCGLIIHELLSNSFKYAFPDGQQGVIGIALTGEAPGQITLQIWDTGVGQPSAEPGLRRPSLGMQLVHDLVRQLRGTITVDASAGTQITITIPAQIAPAPQSVTFAAEKVLS